MKLGRNNKCYCNSGKKYKYCHLYPDQGFTRTKIGWKRIKRVSDKEIKGLFGGGG